jgi:hypothetical protein
MIESPTFDQEPSEGLQCAIPMILETRFGRVSREIAVELQTALDPE